MSPRLFTASDVERAARLAAQNAAANASSAGVEPSVAFAMDIIVGDSPPYYSEDEVRQMLQYLLSKEDIDAEFEDALGMVRR